MTKSCAIVGAGLAGLSAAVHLAKAGYAVTVFEASPKPGGRAYSFRHQSFFNPLDNGQHLLMGCYTETLRLLGIISPTDRLIKNTSLAIEFVKPDRSHVTLKAPSLPHPINLLAALLGYNAFPRRDKAALLSFMAKMYFAKKPLSRENETIAQWLARNNQSETLRQTLWDIIAIGTMNAPPEETSARMFESILRRMFFADNFSSTLIVPGTDLSQLFCYPAETFIRGNGGTISYAQKIQAISREGNSVVLKMADAQKNAFDAVVFAVPHHALEKIDGSKDLLSLPDTALSYSAIITFHFKIGENPLKNLFYGIIDSPMQWVFNHGSHITTVTSAANNLVSKSEEELLALFTGELEKYFSIPQSEIITHQMIKEKRATFIPGPEIYSWREQIHSRYGNIALAGDWTDTTLPATIEGAILSGKLAAEKITSTV